MAGSRPSESSALYTIVPTAFPESALVPALCREALQETSILNLHCMCEELKMVHGT